MSTTAWKHKVWDVGRLDSSSRTEEASVGSEMGRKSRDCLFALLVKLPDVKFLLALKPSMPDELQSEWEGRTSSSCSSCALGKPFGDGVTPMPMRCPLPEDCKEQT